MATLSEREKEEIVTLLARFHTPAQVVVSMRENLGVEVDRFQVRTYDPTNARYEGGDRWRAIFEAARSAYLNSFEDLPIARPAYRLNELQKNYDRASRTGNLALANAILKQAAWETGRVPVSEPRKRHAGPWSVADMTPEERRAKMAQLIDEALGRQGNAKVAAAQGPSETLSEAKGELEKAA